MKVIFHPEAHEEMLESARFYEEKAAGFGSDFLTAVEETTRRIEQFPKSGSSDRANIRRRLVSGFPFTVLYQEQADHRIFIAAIMHQNRRPGYWTSRLQVQSP